MKKESDLWKLLKKNTPEIRVATPYFTPNSNQTDKSPDYYLYETDDWLVFPHELHGLTKQEIADNKPQLSSLIDKIGDLISQIQ